MITKRIYTTCVEAYDYSQAKTVDANVGTTSNGKTVRLVEITQSEFRVNYQIARYRSTFDLVADQADFDKLVEAGCIKPPVEEVTK